MDVPQGSSAAAHPTADLGVPSGAPASTPLSESLANVGRELGAHRVYVFENVRDPDGRLWMNLTSEWLRAGTRGLFEAPGTKLHPYSPDFTRWIEILGDRQVLAGPVAQLPESERRVLGAERTTSIVAVPIFLDDGWWGYLGADDCGRGRAWSEGEIELLRVLAGAIAEDVERQRRVSAEEIIGDRYRSIVQHIPAVTYIDALDDSASATHRTNG